MIIIYCGLVSLLLILVWLIYEAYKEIDINFTLEFTQAEIENFLLSKERRYYNVHKYNN